MFLNNIAINITNDNKLFSSIILIKRLYSYKSKYITKNRDNNKLLSFIIFIEYLYSHENKHSSKNNRNSNSKSKVAITFFITSIKNLV